jgi:hypothetical protein
MKLLIITNSDDGTADQLVNLSKSESIFRWNIDLWQSYELSWGSSLTIVDPLGRCLDLVHDDYVALWRKPDITNIKLNGLDLLQEDRDFALQEYAECLKSITSLLLSEKRFRLIDPRGERKVPKLYQNHLARSYFDTPRSIFSTKSSKDYLSGKVVTKALGYPMITGGNVFLTTMVNQDDLLRPYPWFIQEPIIGGIDITCVHILGHNHFFASDFNRTESSIDWRIEINSGAQSKWHSFLHSASAQWGDQINQFMKKVDLHFGRLDFIYQNNHLFFLECNPNGQFGWLDDEHLNLHKHFMTAVQDHSSTVS